MWISALAPGGVVVRAVVHLSRAVGVERTEAAGAEVVVVRADDHDLVPQLGVTARQDADDVLPDGPADAGVHRRPARPAETVKVWNHPPGAGRRPTSLEPPGQVGRRGVGARGPDQPASRAGRRTGSGHR